MMFWVVFLAEIKSMVVESYSYSYSAACLSCVRLWVKCLSDAFLLHRMRVCVNASMKGAFGYLHTWHTCNVCAC